jgi:hypothetical protein
MALTRVQANMDGAGSRYSVGSFASLTAAVAALGATECTVVIDQSTSITGTTTIPTTMTLEKTRAGVITGAYSLVINGGMTGDLTSQWFNGPTVTGSLIVDAKCFSTLAECVSTIGSTPTTLRISNTQDIPDGTTVTFAPTTSVYAVRGGIFDTNSTGTVTFTGAFDGDLSQHFAGDGSVVGLIKTYPQWFGVVTDSTHDSITAITSAISAASKEVIIDRPMLISSSVNLNKSIALTFLGSRGYVPGSYLIKKDTMTTPGLVITGDSAVVNGGGVKGLAGNTGDGVSVQANGVTLNQVLGYACGGDGIRVGGDSTSSGNFNSCTLNHCYAVSNGRYGVYVHDDIAGVLGDANAGTFTHLYTQNNTSDGLRVDNSFWNTFIGCTHEGNGGRGYTFTANAAANAYIGGDSEANIGGHDQDLNLTGNAFIFGTPAYMPISSQSRVAYGPNALAKETTTNSSNAAFGAGALASCTSGTTDVAVGSGAAGNITTQNGLVAIGTRALESATGNFSVSVGNYSSMQAAGNNVAVGYYALNAATSDANVMIGTQAGKNITTGANNIAIGYFSGIDALKNITTESNQIVMGGTNATDAFIKIDWTVVSDERDKANFAPVPLGLDFVNNLNPIQYQFRIDRDSEEVSGPVRYGFKAQEILALEGVDSVIINADDKDHLMYNSSCLMPVLVNAIKELKAEIEILKAK